MTSGILPATWNVAVAILIRGVIYSARSVPQHSLLSLFMKGVKCLIVINAIAMRAWYPVDRRVVEPFGCCSCGDR